MACNAQFCQTIFYCSIIPEHFTANREKKHLGFLSGPRKAGRSSASGIPGRKLGGVAKVISGEHFQASTDT